ncbi:trypsin-like serine protease [Conidiobolus coronatus NRRL 28638]|uniref:Trypsin-like serine protease n=1 Tax=Conidiobolus coronatus (strain ATCC 28846 / CBS 209.66 / NRRL 28638) TaxID=796925 RepID=A0A137NPN3_CONC2|nr:trypsin-like serine protease [Conidiobolus coronatus NRRL 28638]|eukprot:KXN64699.1 trypsin-like serine protease [Conidiobolus coronatus NRRL 28638]
MLNNLFIIATALLALRAEDTEVVEDEREGRIINGREARPGAYPFVVSLQRNGGHICGGSLLDSTTVLTAAHCSEVFSNEEVTVNVKRHDLRKQSSQEGGETIGVTRQTRHPEYFDINLLNDVGIWKLASPVSVQVSYVTLDNGQYADQVDLPAQMIGWGRNESNSSNLPPRLQETILPIYDNDMCAEAYYWQIDSRAKLCAGYAEGISSTCEGDSGGPLFVQAEGRVIQIGISSYVKNTKCLNANAPAVFTKVANYIPWIKSQQEADDKSLV